MATAMADSVVETKIQTLTKKLSNKHSSWKSHQLKSNDMLYCLLEDCVEFYRFLKSDERYETMFRNLSGVKIKANTKLSNIVAESVFNKGKQTSAYSKVIAIAIEDGYGTEKNTSVLEWLQTNGGVNAVIRNEPKDTKAQQKQYEDIVRNYVKFLKVEPKEITAKHITDEYSDGEYVVMMKVKNNKVDIIDWCTQSESIMRNVVKDMAINIMVTTEYKQNVVEVQAEIDRENTEVAEELIEKMEELETKQKERTDKQKL